MVRATNNNSSNNTNSATKNIEHIFRAYDVRGIYNITLTAELATKFGIALGTLLFRQQKQEQQHSEQYLEQRSTATIRKPLTVCVGRDVRLSSEALEYAITSGLLSAGINVHSIGLVPIHVFNFYLFQSNNYYDAGCYITASHNPPEYNGVRFRYPDGTGYTEENELIKQLILNNELKLARWDAIGKSTQIATTIPLEAYLNFLLARLRIPKPQFKNLRLVVDIGNGSAGLTVPKLLTELGIETVILNEQLNGRFPGRGAEPGPESLHELRKTIIDYRADFGVAFDGDGDRCVILDERGKIAKIEKLAVILAKYLATTVLSKDRSSNNDIGRRLSKCVVANIACSHLLEHELVPEGFELVRVRVGDVFVSETLKRKRALLGVESSAHLFIGTHYPFDDPLLATLCLAEALLTTKDKLSTLLDAIPDYPYVEKKYNCPDEYKFKIVSALSAKYKAENLQVDCMDGIRIVLEQQGWVLIRASNTTPIIRLTVEAESERKVEQLINRFETDLKQMLELYSSRSGM